jgi:hypothetical protein
MKLCPLSEFKKTSGLSDQALIWLLCNNKKACQIDSKLGLCIDLESIRLEQLISASKAKTLQNLKENKEIIVERLALIVNARVQEILDEAIMASQSESE